MKINKKYKPYPKLPTLVSQKADALFPIFLKNFQKTDSAQVVEYLFQLMRWKRKGKEIGKSVSPFFIKGTDSSGIPRVLKSKEALPFPAKLQRLTNHSTKIFQKETNMRAALFAEQHPLISDFLLMNQTHQELFQQLQKKQIWRKSQELVYWDVSSQAIVHPDAIEWREEKQLQLEVKCFVETKNDVFPLVVEDPMLLFSDVGVVVHQNDKRYKKHIGKKIIIPVINKSIPIFGEEGIDTVTNNGIQRLNPLLNHETLERVKAYNLPVNENYIDDEGLFSEKVEHFGKKSVFDFSGNIVETLKTIGNLLSQQETVQKVPYSKSTGQRLIKKVVPTILLDFSELQSDFFLRLEETYPQFKDSFSTSDTFKIIVESGNQFAPKISFLEEKGENITLSLLSDQKEKTPFAFFLLSQLKKGHLSNHFSLTELVDLLFLLPEQEWLNIAIECQQFSKETFLTLQKELKNQESESLIDELQNQLSKLPWLQSATKNSFIFLSEKLWNNAKVHTMSINDAFLQMLALLDLSKENKLFFSEDVKSKSFIRGLLLLLFFTGNQQIAFFPQEERREIFSPGLPERFYTIVEKYGWETLRLLVALEKKYDEVALDEIFDYLKHLWNLFKMLYERSAFFTQHPDNMVIDGKAFRILAQWKELEEESLKTLPGDKNFPAQLSKIQNFTREQFTRYLALLKEEKNAEAFFVAGQIFLMVLERLEPIIPEFLGMVYTVLGPIAPFQYSSDGYKGEKDYKMYLLFDILQGISHQKSKLKLKKHLPIDLCIQANADILHLMEKYESSLTLLFKVQNVEYLAANEDFPSDFHAFSILDMHIGLKSCSLSEQQDSLAQREKDYKAKNQTLEYLRSTLVALSLNPLTDPAKIEQKEGELEALKIQLQELEIKIQKAKMARK